jgi:uncharacterized protein with NAD-binding domain and iron-sulfur cluster
MAQPQVSAGGDRRKHIVILGGGIASIISAFQLTSTEELRKKYRVTIYQMGWRLGGKLACGLNADMNGRNEEHGLHVWFGFYDNAFSCLKTCYEELLAIQPGILYPTYLDAFQPNDFTPVGYRTDNNRYGFWNFSWFQRPGTPGVFSEFPKPLAIIREGLGLLRDWLFGAIDAGEVVLDEPFHLARDFEVACLQAVGLAPKAPSPDGAAPKGFLRTAFDYIEKWIESLEQDAKGLAGLQIHILFWFIKSLKGFIRNLLAKNGFTGPDDHPLVSAMEIGLTIVAGLLNPSNGWLQDFNLNRFDDTDLRAWLIDNSGDPVIVKESSFIRALYDIPFAYEDGDLSRPNFATGAALRWSMRQFFTYRGHALYVPQTGFGQAVIAPYYIVLKQRGVEFNFFHKVKAVRLSPNRNSVDRVEFEVQAVTKADPYDPVLFKNGLYYWPNQPFWDQLKDDDKYKDAGVNFESHWVQQPPVGSLTLNYGVDFDHVILGIPITALKPLNKEDGSICHELIAASPELKAMTDHQEMVATAGVQLWFNSPVTDLGWKARPATVGGPEPLDVWADMSQVLQTEGWQGVANPPQSLHYLCGPIPTNLYAQPASQANTPQLAAQQAEQLTVDWLRDFGTCDWPKAQNTGGAFDWNVLYDPAGGVDSARLKSQFIRTNIDPTECCGTSFAGTTRYRVGADCRLFTNLSIVGADTLTDINVTCVEGATISAMKATRALCGAPDFIPGENYMGGPFPPLAAAPSVEVASVEIAPNLAPQATLAPAIGSASLPAYVDTLGMGQVSAPPPGVFTGTKAWVFGAFGDRDAMQALAHRYIAAPTNGAITVETLGPLILFIFFNEERLTSPSQPIGWTPNHEFTITYPVILREPGHPLKTRLVLWSPMVLIDNARGMVTGRESWGFFKGLGQVVAPQDLSNNFVCSVDTVLFDKFDPQTEGREATLVKVTPTGDLSVPAELMQFAGGANHLCLEFLKLLANGVEDPSLFWGLIKDWAQHELPVVNLKQLRDAIDSSKACYQALTSCQLVVNELRSLHLLKTECQITITPAQSHQLVELLGFKSNVVPVEFGMLADMDYQTGDSGIIWSAGASLASALGVTSMAPGS